MPNASQEGQIPSISESTIFATRHAQNQYFGCPSQPPKLIKKHGIKKHDYYLLIKGKGAQYIVDTGTHIAKKAGKWAQGYIQRKLNGTGNERFK